MSLLDEIERTPLLTTSRATGMRTRDESVLRYVGSVGAQP